MIEDVLRRMWGDLIAQKCGPLKFRRSFYPGEALITAFVLAFVPYLLIRGPVNRIARRRRAGPARPGPCRS